MQDARFQHLLDLASDHGVGVAVLCTSREAADNLRQQLYVVRARARSAGETKYDELSLSISPHSAEILYIYKPKDSNEQP